MKRNKGFSFFVGNHSVNHQRSLSLFDSNIGWSALFRLLPDFVCQINTCSGIMRKIRIICIVRTCTEVKRSLLSVLF
jgi:hypothetical protein